MICKVSLELLDNFWCCFVIQMIEFEIIRIIVYCAQIIFAVEREDIQCDLFPGTMGYFVTD